MTVRSPTATLDEGWDSLLSPQVPAARAVEPMAEVAEVLADITFFYDQGLEEDATAMFLDLRRRHPEDPLLRFAPWDQPEPAVHEDTAAPEVEDDAAAEDNWEADEVDILAALDMLEGYEEAQDTALLDDTGPDAALLDDDGESFHNAVTVVERAPTAARCTSINGTLDYPIDGASEKPEQILVDIDDPQLAAPWFDAAVDALAVLEAKLPSIMHREEWEIDFDDDLYDDEDEVEIDTAEFDDPTPSAIETLTYLPRDLADMRRATGSVTETMPYTEEDRERAGRVIPLTIIPGGIS